MTHQKIQKQSNWVLGSSQKTTHLSSPPISIQSDPIAETSPEEALPAYNPLPENWAEVHPLMQSGGDRPNTTLDTVQRSSESADPEESDGLDVQTKLAVGAPGDEYEQEADRVAEQVVQQIHSSEANHSVQRRGDRPATPKLPITLMRKRADSAAEAIAQPAIETSIEQARGSGHPLDETVREPMENAFANDFSQVKVHHDAPSDRLNRSLNARAFTTGSDIFFKQGEYNPNSSGGQQLLAHELTHVVQQTGTASLQRQISDPTIQRDGNEHVGADPGRMTFLPDEMGNEKAPGEAGYSRRLLGAAGEETENLVEQGLYADARLTNVAPSTNYLDQQIIARGRTKARYQGLVRGDGSIWGAPTGIAQEMYQGGVDWCTDHISTMETQRAEEQQRAESYNAWVPRANGFFTSLTRLEAMQNLLGVTNPQQMVGALETGLDDARAVAARAMDAYEGGNIAARLSVPETDETVTQLSNQTTQAAQEMNAAYLGFQRNLLAIRQDEVNREGAEDRTRLEQINQVKQVVRQIGSTIDTTASLVSGAPARIASVTRTVRHGEAWVGAVRNRRQIISGQRPTHNPTYVTLNEQGEMVVRNVQTGMDRPAGGGEATASPAGPSLSFPQNISDTLGQIADFVYASEVREINSRLEQIKTRCAAIEGVRELLALQQAAATYQTKLNAFALKCNELQGRIADRRREYWQLGVDLDNFARQDRESRQGSQAPGRGEERYATIMTLVGQIREALVVGKGAKAGIYAPDEFERWAQGIVADRGARPPRTDIPIFEVGEQEWSRLSSIWSQIRTFGSNVSTIDELFSGVESRAGALLSQLQVGGGSGQH
ncbi:DUF4157 domain-containing protein [Oxynema sp. CENA135]|uniref:eCIS core domain-containing protein n=1 Tax=Oxynema sp. CENA135 TaxID=984206 RepID=UPI00190C785F|nr:DUF4157 domain-containing protein [Oxynema sp. CENA135]MBK4728592.1 DUF4157 domain-containing protein [Oxynema sp. CENA135]